MKKFDNKGSATAVLLVVLIVVAVGGVGYYIWNKNQTKETPAPVADTSSTTQTVKTGVVTVPANFKENTTKADELKAKSNVSGVEYQYYTDLDTATIITVMTRPKTSKDSGQASINANSEATTFAKVEFPNGTKEVAKAVAVKGDGAEGYLVQVSNSANNAFISYIGAANSSKVVLVTVRSVDTYKTQHQEVVQGLISSLEL